jgi:hypothetical protein
VTSAAAFLSWVVTSGSTEPGRRRFPADGRLSLPVKILALTVSYG